MAADAGWAFATYRNYVAAYTLFLEAFGAGASRYEAIRVSVQTCARNRIAALDPSKPRGEIGRALRNAWATEVAIALPRTIGLDDDRFIAASLHWLGPQAYYAVYQAGLAAILAKNLPLPDRHQQFMKVFHSQFVEKGLLPPPWDAACSGGSVQTGGHTFSGCLIGDEIPVNTLYPADLDDARRVLRLALKTTRDRRFDEVRKALLRSKQVKTKAGKPARNLSTVRQNAEYEGMSPTTTFDFLYRLRIRSNYRDSDTFLAQNVGDITAFYEELVGLATSTLHAVECLVVMALGEKWFEAQLAAFGQRRLPSFASEHSVLARWPRA